jgi:hypothetical protein
MLFFAQALGGETAMRILVVANHETSTRLVAFPAVASSSGQLPLSRRQAADGVGIRA